MPGSSFFRIVGRFSLASAVAFIAIGRANGQVGPADVSLEKAIERTHWWRSQLVNVRLSWECSCPQAVREGIPNLTDEQLRGWFRSEEWTPEKIREEFPNLTDEQLGWFRREEWTWSDSGTRWHEMTHYRFHKPYDSQHWGQDVAMGGKFAASYDYRDDRRVLTGIKIRPMGAGMADGGSGVPLIGLFSGGFNGMWLAELLPSDRVSVVGVTDVNETPCLHILLDRRAHVWLDPTHDYLPCRVGGAHESEFAVVEYQQVDPGLWFPRSGYHRGLSSRTAPDVWTITTVELNRELDRTLFRFPAPELGTVVNNGITNEYYRQGDTSLTREREVASWASQNLRGGGSTAPPTGPASPPAFWMRWTAGGLLAVAAVCFMLTDAIRHRPPRGGGGTNPHSPPEAPHAHE